MNKWRALAKIQKIEEKVASVYLTHTFYLIAANLIVILVAVILSRLGVSRIALMIVTSLTIAFATYIIITTCEKKISGKFLELYNFFYVKFSKYEENEESREFTLDEEDRDVMQHIPYID